MTVTGDPCVGCGHHRFELVGHDLTRWFLVCVQCRQTVVRSRG